jgi:hypothetical protein
MKEGVIMRKSRQKEYVNGVWVDVATWPQEKANKKRDVRKKTSRNLVKSNRGFGSSKPKAN